MLRESKETFIHCYSEFAIQAQLRVLALKNSHVENNVMLGQSDQRPKRSDVVVSLIYKTL